MQNTHILILPNVIESFFPRFSMSMEFVLYRASSSRVRDQDKWCWFTPPFRKYILPVDQNVRREMLCNHQKSLFLRMTHFHSLIPHPLSTAISAESDYLLIVLSYGISAETWPWHKTYQIISYSLHYHFPFDTQICTSMLTRRRANEGSLTRAVSSWGLTDVSAWNLAQWASVCWGCGMQFRMFYKILQRSW